MGRRPAELRGCRPRLRPCSRPLPPGNVLFFGCRRRDQDFYWEAEWEQLQARGCLTLVTAFSREQVCVQGRGAARAGAPRVQARGAQGAGSERPPPPAPQEQKLYVQHRLRALGPLVWELLDGRGAHFYLAG